MPSRLSQIEPKFYPVTHRRWKDFELLFGKNGACGGCWCMHWRLKQSEYDKSKGAGNKRAMKRLIKTDRPPGIIGYLKNEPVAWCCVGPRDSFPKLERSRTLKPIDDQPVWSILCLFVAKTFRNAGLSSQVITAAAEYAFSKGAKIVEGYPYVTGNKKWADPFVFTGLASSFKRAGFKIVAKPSKSRRIVRLFR
ncbi:MAG: GNAT family N-acetyltransferase [candidate division Zixibacteria bacterium]|nr:GNAT family N-acetyltransferase [candidate division Zixibacteria bacterium]